MMYSTRKSILAYVSMSEKLNCATSNRPLFIKLFGEDEYTSFGYKFGSTV